STNFALAGSNLSGTNTGDITLAAVGSTPSVNGASLAAQMLTLQPADATHPGLLTSGTQTIGGAKTFSSTLQVAAGSKLGLDASSNSYIQETVGVGIAHVSGVADGATAVAHIFDT